MNASWQVRGWAQAGLAWCTAVALLLAAVGVTTMLTPDRHVLRGMFGGGK